MYNGLEIKRNEIISTLTHCAFELESGWYNGHYQKNHEGKWVKDVYPIPVITVKELCDIEIQFDRIYVSTKLKRDAALAYSYAKLMDNEFEAFGVEDYLSDYYHLGKTEQDLKDNINASGETEIGFSFTFSFEADVTQLFEFVKLLKLEGFYY